MGASIDHKNDTIYAFKPPRLRLFLAIGRKRNGWYLIFAKPYPTADSRVVTRLDVPGSHANGHRFWFSEKAVTGWEPYGKSLLEYLLSMSPKQPSVVGIISNDCWADRPNEKIGSHIGARAVMYGRTWKTRMQDGLFGSQDPLHVIFVLCVLKRTGSDNVQLERSVVQPTVFFTLEHRL
ncbi:hypothetical protein PQX77_020120 [Marasmius sp. AFHP31]|nr:hypothetical protein PQX77_020120 [Marasmius sp. AFHP31]